MSGSLMALAMLARSASARLVYSLIKGLSVCLSVSLYVSAVFLILSHHPCRSHTLVFYPLIAAIILSEFDINAIQPGCRPKVLVGLWLPRKRKTKLIEGWGCVFISSYIIYIYYYIAGIAKKQTKTKPKPKAIL